MIIREERPSDAVPVRSLTEAAFAGGKHSSQTEAAIVDALREARALVISLVAEEDNLIIGHVGFSPVRIGGADAGWVGLGPISVHPDRQRRGVGAALIERGLSMLRQRGIAGCVVLGDPGYYSRFGFSSGHVLRYAMSRPEYFQALVLAGTPQNGDVTYHPGFDAR